MTLASNNLSLKNLPKKPTKKQPSEVFQYSKICIWCTLCEPHQLVGWFQKSLRRHLLEKHPEVTVNKDEIIHFSKMALDYRDPPLVVKDGYVCSTCGVTSAESLYALQVSCNRRNCKKTVAVATELERSSSYQYDISYSAYQQLPTAHQSENGMLIIDVRQTNAACRHVHIQLEDGAKTVIKIWDISKRENLMERLIHLGNVFSKKDSTGEELSGMGGMVALGLNYEDNKLYPSCRDSIKGNATFESMCWLVPEMINLLKEMFFPEYEEICNAEANAGHCLPPEMLEKMNSPLDDKKNVGSVMLLSINGEDSLPTGVNEQSCRVGVWAKDGIDKAEDWYLVLPKVKHRNNMGVAIQLFHGCAMSLDGRVVPHHTTVRFNENSKSNVYGAFIGSTSTINKDARKRKKKSIFAM